MVLCENLLRLWNEGCEWTVCTRIFIRNEGRVFLSSLFMSSIRRSVCRAFVAGRLGPHSCCSCLSRNQKNSLLLSDTLVRSFILEWAEHWLSDRSYYFQMVLVFWNPEKVKGSLLFTVLIISSNIQLFYMRNLSIINGDFNFLSVKHLWLFYIYCLF